MVIETVGVITLAAAIGYIVRGYVTKPEPKKEIPVKNKEEEFSEPVATFIKLFNENPKRFPLTKEHRFDEFGRRSTLFTITDKHKGISFTVETLHGTLHRNTSHKGLGNVSFLTRLEIDRLFSTIGGYHRKRQAKCRQISPNRARRALINIYKDEM